MCRVYIKLASDYTYVWIKNVFARKGQIVNNKCTYVDKGGLSEALEWTIRKSLLPSEGNVTLPYP